MGHGNAERLAGKVLVVNKRRWAISSTEPPRNLALRCRKLRAAVEAGHRRRLVAAFEDFSYQCYMFGEKTRRRCELCNGPLAAGEGRCEHCEFARTPAAGGRLFDPSTGRMANKPPPPPRRAETLDGTSVSARRKAELGSQQAANIKRAAEVDLRRAVKAKTPPPLPKAPQIPKAPPRPPRARAPPPHEAKAKAPAPRAKAPPKVKAPVPAPRAKAPPKVKAPVPAPKAKAPAAAAPLAPPPRKSIRELAGESAARGRRPRGGAKQRGPAPAGPR